MMREESAKKWFLNNPDSVIYTEKDIYDRIISQTNYYFDFIEYKFHSNDIIYIYELYHGSHYLKTNNEFMNIIIK